MLHGIYRTTAYTQFIRCRIHKNDNNVSDQQIRISRKSNHQITYQPNKKTKKMAR